MRRAWLALGFGLAALWAVWALLLPASSSPEKATVSIPVGAGASAIGRELRRAGVVRSAWGFRLAAVLSGRQKKLKAGDYEVPKDLDVWQVAALLESGKSLLHRLLIREGLSAPQVAELLASQGLADKTRFLALARDQALAKRLRAVGPDLEGVLFPDSYQMARGLSEEAIIEMMVRRFHEKAPAGLLAQGSAIKLSPLQVLTMASIIEKEARAPQDRPMVSAVFRNRMRLKKRLESCATVRFTLGKYSGPVLYKDLDAASDYNTYRHFGLPPGPICSPGLASIEAALRPASTDALYFVAAGDGTHVFSRTLEEHAKAKSRYKKLKKGVVED